MTYLKGVSNVEWLASKRWIVCAVAMSLPCLGQQPGPKDLTQLSLEDLMNMRVTSVSKREQPISKAGAAIFVITQDDIRRSGAISLPDLLRMVPGVNVARMDSNSWAIGIRGFNDLYADKVLVLIDGRSVYNPLFSGVYWDAQDLVLEDIERIEVIRGPGGTIWGANAMNGVINVITKSSKDTQGGLVTAGSGSRETAEGVAQYGGTIGSKGSYRVFGKYFNIDDAAFPDGSHAADGWNGLHGGFRSDWDLSARDTMTVQGDVQRTGEGQTITTVFSKALPASGTFNEQFDTLCGNVLGRWTHTLANGSQTSLQIYDDFSRRTNLGIFIQQNTVNVDFQHHLSIGSRQDLVWGVGARVSDLDLGAGYSSTFSKLNVTDTLFSTFVQDEVKLARSLWLTVGSKFERNDYTGFEFEPSAQLVWTPTNQQSLWISAARAIRQPTLLDSSIHADASVVPAQGVPFGLLTVSGNPSPVAETLRDFEAGYRAQFSPRFSIDLAAFTGYYRNLRSNDPQTPFFTANPGPPHLEIPLVFGNKTRAHTYGAELFLNWSVTKRLRISPGYSRLEMNIVRDPSGADIQPELTPGSVPAQQFQLRSSLALSSKLEWDGNLFFVGRLPASGTPAYTRVDTRLAWRAGESLELSISGQNLLTPRHAEFTDELGTSHTVVERSVFGKISWRF
jgi:iron complex outermembrane recepter protein